MVIHVSFRENVPSFIHGFVQVDLMRGEPPYDVCVHVNGKKHKTCM